MSDLFFCDDSPVAMKCAVVSRWACRKEDAKTRRACGWMWTLWRGEKKCSDCQRNCCLKPLIFCCAARRKGASSSCGCDSKPFCCTWLLEPNLSWAMDRSKTRLAAANYWMSHPSGTPAVSPNPSPTARRRGDPQPPLGPSGQPVVRDGQVEDQEPPLRVVRSWQAHAAPRSSPLFAHCP